MDNLTHSLTGIVAAEAIVQLRARRGAAIDPRWHRAAWLVSVAAHNAPDLDFAYSWITEGKLGYLLHHRGHTHTLALAPVMALLAYGVVYAWARRGRPWDRAEHAWAALIAALGPIGHMLLDFSNSYGVHPLWPIDDHWYAGDTIFIVEPLFWATTIPAVLLATTPRAGRIAWGVALAIAMTLPWLVALAGEPMPIAWPFALACTLLAIGTGAAARAASDLVRPVIAIAASVLVLGAFAASGWNAERLVREGIARARPGSIVLDVAQSPVPTEPACWEAVVVEREREGYFVHVDYVAAWDPIVPVSSCVSVRGRSRTAIDEPATPMRSGSRAVEAVATFRMPLEALIARADRCDVRAFLRFARAPFFVARDGALIAGDLRYDHEEDYGFAELALPARPERCPEHVPPWIGWRADLLGP